MAFQQKSISVARERFHEVEALLVELVDEVEYWKSASQALTREVEALRSERETLIAEQRVAETWRLGLAEELADYGREDPSLSRPDPSSQEQYEYDRNPFRGLRAGVPLAALLWAALVPLAFIAYWLYTS
jgi:hypothetical protein